MRVVTSMLINLQIIKIRIDATEIRWGGVKQARLMLFMAALITASSMSVAQQADGEVDIASVIEVPPASPPQVSVFFEDGAYVFRLDESEAIYYYDLDKPDVSNCNDECLHSWQPLTPEDRFDRVGDWNVFKRTDGSKQWAYKKRPVYIFLHDVPGKALGDGREGLWHVVAP